VASVDGAKVQRGRLCKSMIMAQGVREERGQVMPALGAVQISHGRMEDQPVVISSLTNSIKGVNSPGGLGCARIGPK